MSKLIRLYIDPAAPSGAASGPFTSGICLSLDSLQSHYLHQVMRKRAGDAIEVFNGRDGAFRAQITQISRREAVIELEQQVLAPVKLRPVALCFAPLKRGPVETIVQKATELGATQIQPVRTARTSANPVKQERLTSIMIESAEQCERLSIPELLEETPLETLVSALDYPLIFADEEGMNESNFAPPMLDVLSQRQNLGESKIGILIGPEGGFAPAEREFLRSSDNIIPVSLGARILRADTAAIAALSLLQAMLDRL